MSDREGEFFDRAQEAMMLYRRGAGLLRQLLRDNQRLRHRIARGSARFVAADLDPWAESHQRLLDDLGRLEEQTGVALAQLENVERESRRLATRCLEIDVANNNLVNLYVAINQLHSTLDPSEVVRVVSEIVIDLIGAKVFAIYLLDERTGRISAVGAEGDKLGELPEFELGRGVVGGAVKSGEVHCNPAAGIGDHSRPMVCIPLRVGSRPIGAIAIHRFLEQKDRITSLDRELFTMMAGHAATSIFAAGLYSRSVRKLKTVRGLIDLPAN